VLFDEEKYKSKKKSTQKILTNKLQEDRKQMEKEIVWLKLRTVGWHHKTNPEQGTKVEIWRPQHVPSDGCDFHVIIRDAFNSQLMTYALVKFREKAVKQYVLLFYY
ncbi:uncharacterized protein LOC117118067, partial [Anneissia japonica]|uniref:uncharacterized protein LOC117118067 n=1 Tax=Anneissia japonica TaxID=1529436 RepID=UPI0014258F5A